MKQLKKILAVVLSVLFVLSFCACEMHSKNEDVATISKTTVGSELYIMYLVQADNDFRSAIDEQITEAKGTAISDAKEYYKKTLDGKDADTWISDKAMSYCKEYAWTTENFEAFGLTLDDEQKASVDQYVYYYWDYYGNSETYEGYGISKDAFRLYWEQLIKKEAIFDYFYNEGGKEEVSKDDIFKNITETFIQAETVTITLLDANGNKLTGDALKKEQDKAQSYVDRFNKGEATMAELNKENSGETNTSSTVSSTVTPASTVTSTTASGVTSGSAEKEEIKSKYENAVMLSEDGQDVTTYEKLKEVVAKEDFVGYDKAAFVETDNSIIVYVIRDMNTDKEFIMETYLKTGLHNIKDEEFEKKITDAIASLTVTTTRNIKRYKASDLMIEE